jgi:hypothetical protein
MYLTKQQVNDIAAWEIHRRLPPEYQVAVRLRYGNNVIQWFEDLLESGKQKEMREHIEEGTGMPGILDVSSLIKREKEGE